MRNALWLTILAMAVLLFSEPRASAEQDPPAVKSLGGLKGTVEIVIDRYGFPHIFAESEADAMFALGYMHAKDRLWQMDFNRRAAQGRLSEIMGSAAADHDVFVRTIGLNRLAASAAERLEKHERIYRDLTSYAWGVNSYIAEHMPEDLPFEFQQLGYQPEPWSVADSLSIGKAMAWELCGSFDDLYMGVLAEKLGRRTLYELFPINRHAEIPIIPPEAEEETGETGGPEPAERSAPGGVVSAYLSAIRMESRTFSLLGAPGGAGSNNWVIDGAKSASGKPILASDPHLGFQMPCVWYVAHVHAGALETIGVTLPGLPVTVIGHNRNIAWGMTNTQADVTDFFIETLNEDKTRYLYKGQWKPLEIHAETIKVRGQEPRALRISETVHGPILSTAEADLAIQWIGSEPDEDARAFYLLNRASDYDDFAAAMRTINAPPQNFNYADTNGMIAMWVAGLFPIRKAGDGRIPVDGASGEYDWTGFIPRIDTPRSVNPSQRYLASANQRPAPKSYPYYLGYEWDPGYRARRINQLLSSHDSITMEMMQGFQADTYDTAAESMLPRMIAACTGEFEEGKLYAQALRELSQWDYSTTTDKSAPTIWWTWLDKFRDAVWRDEWRAAGIEVRREPWGHTDLNKWQPPLEALERILVEQPSSKWLDDVSTERRETLRDVASASLREAVDELLMQFGEDISKGQWGRLNRLRIDHLSGDPLLVRGGQSLDGCDLALNARGTGSEVTGGPSWRMVVDFNDIDSAVGVYPGGQSGDPENPHYDDLIDEWVHDGYVPLLFYREPGRFPEEQVESRLRLTAPPETAEIMAPQTGAQ